MSPLEQAVIDAARAWAVADAEYRAAQQGKRPKVWLPLMEAANVARHTLDDAARAMHEAETDAGRAELAKGEAEP